MKALGRKAMMTFLEKKGCKVIGETERFNGSEEGFYELSEEDQENEIELLGCYLRTYNDIFNL